MQPRWFLWRNSSALTNIVTSDNPTPIEHDAATELQRFLEQASGSKWRCLSESTYQGSGIYVGRTQFLARKALFPDNLPDEAYLLWSEPRSNALVLCGASEMATAFAVYDFLHRYLGVRWYLPTELFQVVPRRDSFALPAFRIVETPAFSPRTFGYVWMGEKCSYTGEKHPVFGCDRWAVRNRLSVDGRLMPQFHSHNLYNIVSPQKYGSAHPEYFPLRAGKRYVPSTPTDQDWQPCLTNPDVVRLAVEAGKEFFRQHPHEWQWFSLGINDGFGWCECDRCRAANGSPAPFRSREVQSEVYYLFVEKVAVQLSREFPRRKVGLIAYLSVEKPPQHMLRLPTNVVVVITQETAQHHDAAYRQEDVSFVQEWLHKANGQVYRYDYHGLTWVMPRYFPTLVAQDVRRMKQLGLKGYYTEDVPTWSTMGPLLYLTARLWWNPFERQQVIVDEFFRDLFGKAAPAMRRVFAAYEKIWMRPRKGRFFEGLSGPRDQVQLYRGEDITHINKLFEQALRLADSDIARRRVRLFEQGWRLSEFYLKEHLLAQQLTTGSADTALQLLETLRQHEAFYAKFREEDALFSGTYRWMLEELSREGAWKSSLQQRAVASLANAVAADLLRPQSDSEQKLRALLQRVEDTETRKLLSAMLRWLQMPSAQNVLRNPEFRSSMQEWQESPPPEWGFWRATRGIVNHRDGAARIIGQAEDLCILQEHPASAGELVVATVRYRTEAGKTTTVYLRCRWRTDTGWFPAGGGGERDLLAEGTAASQGATLTLCGIVPEGATRVLLLLGARQLGAEEWVEFEQPYLAASRV